MRLTPAKLLVLAIGPFLGACDKEPPTQPVTTGKSQPSSTNQSAEDAPELDEAVIVNNRGVGLMGKFEYGQAREAFADVVEMRPDWLDARVNLAIATLNRQQEGDTEEALRILDGVLSEDPSHARANFCTGLLKLHLGPPNDPLSYFQVAAKAVPDDPVAAYYVGQSLGSAREHEASLEWFQRAIEADPYLRSAYYAASRALRVLRRADEADEMLASFQRLEKNPRGHTVEFKYKKMGALGEAVPVGAPAATTPPRPEGDPIAFTPLYPEATIDPSRYALTTCDINADGEPERFFVGAALGDQPNSLYFSGEADLPLDAEFPFVDVVDVNAALWGDVDNDGLVDLYLCRAGANQLWRQDSLGHWAEVGEKFGVTNGDADTVDGALFDADHDGDLDIFCVNADAPNDLLSNNGDSTFRSISAEQALSGGDRPSRQVVVADLDSDRDVDIIVIHAQGDHEVFLNDRMWAYRAAPGVEGFTGAGPLLACVHADLGADGVTDLVAIDAQGDLQHWTWNGNGLTHHAPLATGNFDSLANARLSIADVTGDGRLEIIASDDNELIVFGADGSVIQRAAIGLVMPDGRVPSGGPTFVGIESGMFRLGMAGPGRFKPYATVMLAGADDPGQSMRTNASAIGARVAARVGTQWTVLDTFRNTSGPGQSLQPLAFGLAGRELIDFIEIDWPDGVFQSELEIPAGKLTHVAETQRQLSSCPVLFAWNGERYEFVTDLLGVGGIGYAVGPNEYAPARPWENVLLPAGIARRTGAGHYSLLLTEPMEEACYLDAAGIIAYDLPPGWELVLDERMGINDPQPTGEARFFRFEVTSSRAINDRNEDVTRRISSSDLDPAPVGPIDRRFIGRLAREHVLTLEFDEPLDVHAGDPILIADGWIEYPYSQTSFAAWQAGADYRAPTVEARTADGPWITIHDQIGYPAGMPRRMSAPLPGLPAGCTAIRIRTNQEIYWDRISIAFAEPCPEARRVEGDLVEARLSYAGFPKRLDLPDRLPNYDYDDRTPFWDTRHQTGLYTAYGSCTELVSDHDDAVAIFGPGEQIALTFDLDEPAHAEGWTRRLVLETRGWCKDMDLFTNTGETIEPMPTSGRPAGARDELNDRFNTRFQSGR